MKTIISKTAKLFFLSLILLGAYSLALASSASGGPAVTVPPSKLSPVISSLEQEKLIWYTSRLTDLYNKIISSNLLGIDQCQKYTKELEEIKTAVALMDKKYIRPDLLGMFNALAVLVEMEIRTKNINLYIEPGESIREIFRK